MVRNPSLRKIGSRIRRPDTLDPALLRSGRLDRKIELPHPNEETGGSVRGQMEGGKMGGLGGLVGWVGLVT